jgi:hypothetical protein
VAGPAISGAGQSVSPPLGETVSAAVRLHVVGILQLPSEFGNYWSANWAADGSLRWVGALGGNAGSRSSRSRTISAMGSSRIGGYPASLCNLLESVRYLSPRLSHHRPPALRALKGAFKRMRCRG